MSGKCVGGVKGVGRTGGGSVMSHFRHRGSGSPSHSEGVLLNKTEVCNQLLTQCQDDIVNMYFLRVILAYWGVHNCACPSERESAVLWECLGEVSKRG